jgi:1,4-alpha-glucan branching enzyme
MKIRLLYLIFIGITQVSFPQVVSTFPLYPTENDSIIVYFDATKGDAGLKGFSGDVYAHTGVITNLSKDSHDWKYVMAPWATNYPDIKLTRDSVDHYHLVIGKPRIYYADNHSPDWPNTIPSSEHIQKLAFVFRNADGSKTGRDVGSADIFTPLYKSGLTVNFDKPNVSIQYSDPLRSPYFIRQSDSVNIEASAVGIGTKISTLTLYINDTQIIQTGTDSLKYTFIASEHPGENQISVIGIDTAGIPDTSSFAILLNPSPAEAQLPQGNQLGINYNSSTSVTLALYAPYKSFVYVIGDFNDWKVDSAYLMKKDSVKADSVVWWATINNLTAGKEYAYQYLVGGNLRIADPFSHKILDPSNDPYISDTVYPNLKPYPSGKTSEIVSVLQTDQQQYNWQVTNFRKPKITNLVIYELLVRDFVSTHWYKTF